MSRIIYFTRHGAVGHDGRNLSEDAKDKLLVVRRQLIKEFHFSPMVSFSSWATRCIETAKVLAPEADLKADPVDNELFHFGNIKTLFPLADKALESIAHQSFEDEKILVVGHDCFPAILAIRLIEKRGRKIDWWGEDYSWISSLAHGQGIFVKDAEFFKIGF